MADAAIGLIVRKRAAVLAGKEGKALHDSKTRVVL
jgi:hypothetical protein